MWAVLKFVYRFDLDCYCVFTLTVSPKRPPFYLIIFGVLKRKFDMNIWQICWEIKKIIFQHYYSYTSDYLRYLRRKQIATVVLQPALAVYLLLFSASYYLHRPNTGWGTLQEERVYWYGPVEACGSGLLRHGLNFSTAWCTMRLIGVEKEWKHVLTQKMITMNNCCDVACLIFQLPHITAGSFQSHRRQPTTGFFQSHQHC